MLEGLPAVRGIACCTTWACAPSLRDYGRFSYVEKAEYWALIWGSAVMVVTGLLLWFDNWFIQFLPKGVLDVALVIHYWEAWLATLAILVWHLYSTVFNPKVYPMNPSLAQRQDARRHVPARAPRALEQAKAETAEYFKQELKDLEARKKDSRKTRKKRKRSRQRAARKRGTRTRPTQVEILGQRRLHLAGTFALGVGKAQQRAVQQLPEGPPFLDPGVALAAHHAQVGLLGPSVEDVAQDRVADGGQVDTQLVPPPGAGEEAQQRAARDAALHAPLGERRLAVARLHA